MKPINGVAGGMLVSAAILFGLAFLASQVAPPAVEFARASSKREAVTAPETTGLLIDIENVRNDRGNVLVAVFDTKMPFEQYDFERASAFAEVPARAGTIQVHFEDLSQGPYAVSFFHDENNDYDLNLDGLYPLEGYGTSGARDSDHEPTFEEASVEPGRITLRMYYLR